MSPSFRLAAALAALGAALPLAAQTAASPPAAPTSPSATPEPNVQRVTIQDDAVRIEELRVRGQTQRIVVQPKGVAAYEVIPSSAARDPSAGPHSGRGGAGQRVWSVLDF